MREDEKANKNREEDRGTHGFCDGCHSCFTPCGRKTSVVTDCADGEHPAR